MSMLGLTRLPDWRVRLGQLLIGLSRREFEWRERDCAFGLGGPAIEAVTGVSVLPEGVPAYVDAEGAKDALRAQGAEGLADWLSQRFEDISPAKARAGDICVIPSDQGIGEAIGVYAPPGERIGVLTPRGYGTIMRAKYRSFKIG